MPKVAKESQYDTFAWLISQEVEKYVMEREADFNIWLKERNANKESDTNGI